MDNFTSCCSAETVTNMDLTANVLTYVNENGLPFQIDLCEVVQECQEDCNWLDARMTRDELIALRDAAGLKPCGHYIVTDYNRECVGAAQILLHAVTESTLSQTAMVFTTYQNSGWDGVYDIDSNKIVQLQDNLGNFVRGQDGDEVDAFDWGNTSYSGVTVDNAQLIKTKGSTTSIIRDSQFNSGSFTDLTGHIGLIQSAEFNSNAFTDITDGIGNILNSEIKSNARLNLFDSSFEINRSEVSSNALVDNAAPGSSILTIDSSTISEKGEIKLNHGGLSNTTVLNSKITSAGELNRLADSTGNFTMSQSSITEKGVMNDNGQGNKDMRDSQISGSSTWNYENNVAGSQIFYSTLSTNSTATVDSVPRHFCWYTTIIDISRMTESNSTFPFMRFWRNSLDVISVYTGNTNGSSGAFSNFLIGGDIQRNGRARVSGNKLFSGTLIANDGSQTANTIFTGGIITANSGNAISNILDGDSTLDMNGGNIRNSNIRMESVVDVQDGTFNDSNDVTASKLTITSGGDFRYNTIESGSVVVYNGSWICEDNTISSGSTVTFNITGAQIGDDIRNNTFESGCTVTIDHPTENTYVKGAIIHTTTAPNVNKGADYFNNNLV